MKKQFNSLIITLLMLGSLAVPVAFAHPGNGRGSGWGMGDQCQRIYNPDTVETISGEVISVDTITTAQGMSGGVHLRVRTQAGEEISVHLGPAWYINNQEIQIQVNDTIEVRGSRIMFEEQPTLIAAIVKKDDQVLTLRDDAGVPVWAGWRRRR